MDDDKMLARLTLIERRLASIERLLVGISNALLKPAIVGMRTIGRVDENGTVHWHPQ